MLKFKKLTPIDKEGVTYFVDINEIAFMSQFETKQQGLIINPNEPKSQTLVQLKNGQNIAVRETVEQILTVDTVH